jgi:hypothetical protein
VVQEDILRVGIFLAAALTGAPAHATLGGDADSVVENQHELHAAHAVEKLDAGERHRLKLASGMIIHEYLSAGRVYAVTWRGSRMPDLRQLLGPYFEQLEQHRVRRRGSHHASQSTGDDLVVQSSGHGHSFAGRAWVPSLVPAGVDVAKLSSDDR